MKANKFVEKFGWDAAKEALTLACDKLEHVNYGNHAVLISDLKRLVENHELVEKFGGLDQAKIELESTDYNSERDFYESLKQAIADVESCQ